MANTDETLGRVTFLDGHGDLPKIEISTRWSDAEIYLQGAHITHFQKKNEAPLLFLSQVSRFQEGTAIRGGIPIIFPWFGARDGQSMHGFARTQPWRLKEILTLPNGEVSARLTLPDLPEAALFPRFTAEYLVTVGAKLTAELIVLNESTDQEFVFENCLHTYFHVGEISAVSVRGLQGVDYLDKVENFARKEETNEEIRIGLETDRVYLDTTGTVEIHDENLRRKIVVEKSGSNSTVVWNPWSARAQQMPDFGNDDYLGMVCVESGNVAENKVTLDAGQSAVLKIVLSTLPL
ncbi:MAG: D-hexose-6-phosphate mutarotase [Verrucomicrobia bacterium]|nr:D-hexose-6-phosphate mutarotase [Verrucomicrobiota bacterium]